MIAQRRYLPGREKKQNGETRTENSAAPRHGHEAASAGESIV